MSIVSQAEVLTYSRNVADVTDGDLGALTQSWLNAEAEVKAYLGFNVEAQAAVTEYLPITRPIKGNVEETFGFDALKLREIPVRSITSVNEDAGGFFGQASGAFPSSSLLTSGSDYYLALDYDSDANGSMDASLSGLVLRSGNGWPSVPGSVKIIYAGGWSSNALIPGDIREAVLIATADYFVRRKDVKAGGRGKDLASEKLGDFMQSWDPDPNGNNRLPTRARDMLDRWRRVHLVG